MYKIPLNVDFPPSASCRCGRWVHPIAWGGLCTFCFPHSIWSLSPFRNVPAGNVQALSRGPESQLPVRGKPRALHAGLCPHLPRLPRAQGLLPRSAHSRTLPFHTRPSSGAFQQQLSPPARRTATLTVPFTGYVSEETFLTPHPHQPPSSPLFLKYVRPEL